MIIIPELRTVVLQPPRTGSTSVRDAVLAKYPLSFMLYRHMEVSGIPRGYERWRKICQIRHPVSRLQSVYKYMCNPPVKEHTSQIWLENCKRETSKGFEEWLVNGQYAFTANEPNKTDSFRPQYLVDAPIPEQRKSQFYWGHNADEFIHFEDLEDGVRHFLNVEIEHKNQSEEYCVTESPAIDSFIQKFHAWDLNLYKEY